MNKNDENKKNNIIIGIAAFSFVIAIAIIAISFFAPKSHAQVLDDKFQKAAKYTLNKSYSKPAKDDVKQEWSQNNWEKKAEFKLAHFVKAFNQFDNPEKKEQWDVMFKEGDKTPFTADAKLKDWVKVFGAKEFASFDTFTFVDKFDSDKWV